MRVGKILVGLPKVHMCIEVQNTKAIMRSRQGLIIAQRRTMVATNQGHFLTFRLPFKYQGFQLLIEVMASLIDLVQIVDKVRVLVQISAFFLNTDDFLSFLFQCDAFLHPMFGCIGHKDALLPELRELLMKKINLERGFENSLRPLRGSCSIAYGNLPGNGYNNNFTLLRGKRQAEYGGVGHPRLIGVKVFNNFLFVHELLRVSPKKGLCITNKLYTKLR